MGLVVDEIANCNKVQSNVEVVQTRTLSFVTVSIHDAMSNMVMRSKNLTSRPLTAKLYILVTEAVFEYLAWSLALTFPSLLVNVA